jgi:hypothetical protein
MHVLMGDDELVPMDWVPYKDEQDLQSLLAKNPDLMPGELIGEADPRRWLLISREAAIAVSGEGGSRFYLDHLFIDQDGVPTLVEVKRLADTRARREVVAQMLDYAASLMASPPGAINELFRDRCTSEKCDADDLVITLLGSNGDPEQLWSRVDSNLHAGKIRMVFVAERISRELTQIIEFLNSQFSRAEALGVEVVRWKAEGVTALASKVVGRTAAAQAAKASSPPSQPLTAEEYDEELLKQDVGVADSIRDLMHWCESHGGNVSYGAGRAYPACYLNWTTPKGTEIWPLILILSSGVTVSFDVLQRRPSFDEAQLREDFYDRLNQVPGVALPPGSSTDHRPTIPFSVLKDPGGLNKLKDALAWFVAQLKTPQPTA